nr:lasso peptide biosynthesis PqqD family chaperone [Kineosporia rhizophila]
MILTETDQGMVLLDERAGRYWQLNSTGATVLQRLKQGASVQEAIDELARSRPEAADRIAVDVRAFVDNLQAAGVVRP